MNTYEEKQARRKERLEDRAAKLDTEAHTTFQQAKTMADAIPFGQPILVGHHSEGRDRRYRARYGAKFDKSMQLHKEAERTAQRAASVGTGGISSDDPDALVKLRTQLDGIEASQKLMAGINAAWRKAKKPAPDEAERWKPIAAAVGISYDEMAKVRLASAKTAQLYPYITRALQPFQPYELSNNNANIGRIKKRIARLEQQQEAAAAEPATEREINGVQLVENREDNRLQLFFPGKPDAAMRGSLKAAGFRWAPSVGAWQRHLSNQALWQAERLLERALYSRPLGGLCGQPA